MANYRMVSSGKLRQGSWRSMSAKKKAVVAHPPGFRMPAALPRIALILNVEVGEEPMAAKP